jgi:hypothetical protein
MGIPVYIFMYIAHEFYYSVTVYNDGENKGKG